MLFDGTYERLYETMLFKNNFDHEVTRKEFEELARTIRVSPDRFVSEMLSYLPRRRKHEQM